MTDTAPMDNSTNVNTAGGTLRTIDLNELQSMYKYKCKAIQKQIVEQCTDMEGIQNQLQKTFEQQIQQLELKMELNAKQMFHDFGQCFQVVMQKIEELVVDQTEMKAMSKDGMTQILQAIQTKSSRVIPLQQLEIHPNAPTRLYADESFISCATSLYGVWGRGHIK